MLERQSLTVAQKYWRTIQRPRSKSDRYVDKLKLDYLRFVFSVISNASFTECRFFLSFLTAMISTRAITGQVTVQRLCEPLDRYFLERVAFLVMLAQIQTHLFFLFGYAQTHRGFEYRENDHGADGRKHPCD